MTLLREYRGHLVADLHQYHGLVLSQVRESGLSLFDLADIAANLPRESATNRALDPAWRHTVELELLRKIEFRLRALEWQNAGGKGRTPEQVLFAWEEAERDRPDAMGWDEAAEFFGDDRLRAMYDELLRKVA